MKKAKWLAAMTVLFLCTGEVPGVQAQEEESDKPVLCWTAWWLKEAERMCPAI